jgi:hypothetical protein
MDAESFKVSVHPLLKTHGFKRNGATWRREQDESIAVFNVQKSGWGDGVFYINIGVYFRAIGPEVAPPENRCHVRTRLQVGEPSIVETIAISWFDARATLAQASALSEQDSKHGLVFKAVRNFAA